MAEPAIQVFISINLQGKPRNCDAKGGKKTDERNPKKEGGLGELYESKGLYIRGGAGNFHQKQDRNSPTISGKKEVKSTRATAIPGTGKQVTYTSGGSKNEDQREGFKERRDTSAQRKMKTRQLWGQPWWSYAKS